MPKPPWKNAWYVTKLNYVVDAWAAPCEAPWYIIVETMGPAALKALITFATFGWDDVFRGYVRPKQLRRTGKMKKPFRIKGVPIYFPEIGEWIGKRLPWARRFQAIVYRSGSVTMWRIDSVLQRGLFYWLVADIAVDFFFNWTSQLYATEWCKFSDLGRVSHTNEQTEIIGAVSEWRDFNVMGVDYAVPPIFFGVHHWITYEHPCMLGAAGVFHDWMPLGGDVQMRIRRVSDDVIVGLGEKLHWEIGFEVTPAVYARVKVPGHYIVEYWCSTPTGLCRVHDRVAFGQEHFLEFSGNP
ncbi:MAG: hypothetical protein FVQ82_17705 [Planctomycetes bacterium]|nr:hypothetical protein [Planctomycetota bacterium]